jgi:hypothetical protein
MCRIRKAGLGGGVLRDLRGLFIILIQTWYSVGMAQGGTSVVGWGYLSAVPPEATNVSQVIASIFGNSAIRKDGTVVIFDYYYGPTFVLNSNLFSIGVAESAIMELASDHIVRQSNGVPILSNVVALVPYVFLKADGTVEKLSGNTLVDLNYSNVVAVSSGPPVKSDGTVINDPYDPAPPGLTDVVATAGGVGFYLALRRDGTVVVWGTPNNSVVSKTPQGLSNVVSIAAGDVFAAVLKSDGTVIAWGDNGFGETNIPSGLTNVTAISAAGREILALVDTDFPGGVGISGAMTTNKAFTVTFPSLSGKVYSLEYTTTLNPPNWTFLPLVAGTGDTLTLLDTNLRDSQRFYRVRRW